MRKKLTAAQKAKREDKRERRAARSEPAGEPVTERAEATFGEVVERAMLPRTITKTVQQLIRQTETDVGVLGKTQLRVASCHGCTAPKGCCSLRVLVYLHEAVPIADRLRREGRDTPELRAALQTSAELMETVSAYRRPCVLLDERERCTVYEHRPIECGTAFVFSPPAMCSDPRTDTIEKFVPDLGEAPQKMEQRFEREAHLQQLQGLYLGALPRMLLLCLEAWDRTDYAQYLAEAAPAAAKRAIAATRAALTTS